MSASLGVYRALEHLGVMPHIDGVAAASGGSWASAVYFFVNKTLDQLLGKRTDPAKLTPQVLKQVSSSMGWAASQQGSPILNQLFSPTSEFKSSEVWPAMIGAAMLGLFELDDCNILMAPDLKTVERIKQKNPQLNDTKFIVPAPGRPKVFVILVTLLGPIGYDANDNNAVALQISPDWTGVPFYPLNSRVTYETVPGKFNRPYTLPDMLIGGGFVETFAFGGDAPERGQSGGTDVEMWAPLQPMCLSRAIGLSSAGPGAHVAQYMGELDLTDLIPRVDYWPITSKKFPAHQSMTTHGATDGGSIDNAAIIPMLQRGANKLLSLLNTAVPLPAENPDFCQKKPIKDDFYKALDPTLSALFGYHPDVTGFFYAHAKVFKREQLAGVVCEMMERKHQGKTNYVRTQLDVVSNLFWGVVGGHTVDIAFVYLEQTDEFEKLLPAETQELIRAPGDFKNFPQYDTIFQVALEAIALQTDQINLLAAQQEYTIRRNIEDIYDLFKIENPRVEVEFPFAAKGVELMQQEEKEDVAMSGLSSQTAMAAAALGTMTFLGVVGRLFHRRKASSLVEPFLN